MKKIKIAVTAIACALVLGLCACAPVEDINDGNEFEDDAVTIVVAIR